MSAELNDNQHKWSSHEAGIDSHWFHRYRTSRYAYGAIRPNKNCGRQKNNKTNGLKKASACSDILLFLCI